MPVTVDILLRERQREGQEGQIALAEAYDRVRAANPQVTPEQFVQMLRIAGAERRLRARNGRRPIRPTRMPNIESETGALRRLAQTREASQGSPDAERARAMRRLREAEQRLQPAARPQEPTPRERLREAEQRLQPQMPTGPEVLIYQRAAYLGIEPEELQALAELLVRQRIAFETPPDIGPEGLPRIGAPQPTYARLLEAAEIERLAGMTAEERSQEYIARWVSAYETETAMIARRREEAGGDRGLARAISGVIDPIMATVASPIRRELERTGVPPEYAAPIAEIAVMSAVMPAKGGQRSVGEVAGVIGAAVRSRGRAAARAAEAFIRRRVPPLGPEPETFGFVVPDVYADLERSVLQGVRRGFPHTPLPEVGGRDLVGPALRRRIERDIDASVRRATRREFPVAAEAGGRDVVGDEIRRATERSIRQGLEPFFRDVPRDLPPGADPIAAALERGPRQFVARTSPLARIFEMAYPADVFRSLGEALRIPGIKFEPWSAANPAIIRDPLLRMLIAYKQDVILRESAVSEGVRFLSSRVQRLRPDREGVVQAVTAKTDAPEILAARHWQDVFERGERFYVVSETGKREISAVHRLLDEVLDDYKALRGRVPEIKFVEGEHYIPHEVVGWEAIDDLRNWLSSGGRRPWELGRAHEYVASLVARGGRAEADMFASLEAWGRGVARATADLELREMVFKRLGRTPSQMIPRALRVEVAERLAQKGWARQVAQYARSQAAARGRVRRPNLRPRRGMKPDPALTAMVDEIARAVGNKPALRALRERAETAFRAYRNAHAGAVSERSAAIRRAQRAGISSGEPWGAEGKIAVGRVRLAPGRIFPRKTAEQINRTMTPEINAFLKATKSVSDVARFFLTAIDVGFMFTLGLLSGARFPARAAGVFARAFVALGRPSVVESYMVRNHAVVMDMLASQAPVTIPDFMVATRGGTIQRALTFGELGRRFARSFEFYFTGMQIEGWKALRPIAPTPQARRELGAFLRNLTGAMNPSWIGVGPNQQAVEAVALRFAPNYFRATMAVIADAARGGIRGSQARRSLMQLLGMGVLAHIGMATALGQKPSLDPRQGGRFLAVRVGENYVGWGGMVFSIARTVAESFEAAKDDPERFLSWDSDNPLVRYARSGAPVISGGGWDYITGRNFVGQATRTGPIPTLEMLRQQLPFWMEAMLDARGDMGDRLFIGAMEFLGLRTFPMSPFREADLLVAEDAYFDSEGNKLNEYGQLDHAQRIDFRDKNPDLIDEMKDRLKEIGSPSARLFEIEERFEAQLAAVGRRFEEDGDGDAYRRGRADVLGRAAGAYSEAVRAVQFTGGKRTPDQKVYDAYISLMAMARDPETGEFNFDKWRAIERWYRAGLGPDGREVLDRQIAASADEVERDYLRDMKILEDKGYPERYETLWRRIMGDTDLGSMPYESTPWTPLFPLIRPRTGFREFTEDFMRRNGVTRRQAFAALAQQHPEYARELEQFRVATGTSADSVLYAVRRADPELEFLLLKWGIVEVAMNEEALERWQREIGDEIGARKRLHSSLVD